ncbi:hypothetical protein ACQEUU_29635 [Nonomuraea sp. CA-218870]|uniref:hypothetical protein n=1 Tax=Nonomuraea sp. CA-218870 TaxID=3239998 RepID=UPI003D90F807
MMGVVLYGPPASGKSATTVALGEVDPRFALVRKLKVGNRRGTEYEFVSAEELTQLRAAGRLLIETHRYGNNYAIDRHHIDRLTAAGQVPIVHLDNIADIRRLIQSAPWLVVLLWTPARSVSSAPASVATATPPIASKHGTKRWLTCTPTTASCSTAASHRSGHPARDRPADCRRLLQPAREHSVVTAPRR